MLNYLVGVTGSVSQCDRTKEDRLQQQKWNPNYKPCKPLSYDLNKVENYCGSCTRGNRTLAYDDPNNNLSYKRDY